MTAPTPPWARARRRIQVYIHTHSERGLDMDGLKGHEKTDKRAFGDLVRFQWRLDRHRTWHSITNKRKEKNKEKKKGTTEKGGWMIHYGMRSQWCGVWEK